MSDNSDGISPALNAAEGHAIDMSASMLGVSSPNLKNRSDGQFQEIHPFSPGRVWQPYIDDVSSPTYSSPVTEDEETRHGFLSHTSGSSSTFNRELLPTVSTFKDTIQPANTFTAVKQVHVSSLDRASIFDINQTIALFEKLQINTDCQLPAVENSSYSFNPHAGHDHYSIHPLATHHRSMEHMLLGIKADESDSLESEQPTDLSMPKNSLQNLDEVNIEDDNSCENADASQDTCYGCNESPIRQLTYTHLSDVSNDSEEGSDVNPKNMETFTSDFAKKRFEPLVPHQLALPWIFTHPIIERPNMYMLHLAVRWAQMIMGPSAIAFYIFWLLHNQFFHMIELLQKIPKQQKQKIVELKENSSYEHSDATRSAENMADKHIQPTAEEVDVIHLNPDDDDKSGVGSEQLQVQPSAVCSVANQQLLAQVPTLVQTAEQRTLPLQGPVPPVLALTLPLISHLEFRTLPMDSLMSPEKDTMAHLILSQPSSSRNSCAQQSYYFPLPMLKEHSHSPREDMRQHFTDASSTQLLLPDSTNISARQKRPYREAEAMCEAAHCSGPKQLRRSLRLQSVAKESTCTSVKRNTRPRNHQDRRRPKPTDEKAQCITPTRPQQSPNLEAETRNCAPTTGKRRREPWDHKGLQRFVAENAFKLPRRIWTERKEGEPRRSMRLARKMQCRTYFLRPRLHTKK